MNKTLIALGLTASLSAHSGESTEILQGNKTTPSSPDIDEITHAHQEAVHDILRLAPIFRLPENRDLDTLFDGDINYGAEELTAVAGFVKIINNGSCFNEGDEIPMSAVEKRYGTFTPWLNFKQNYDYSYDYSVYGDSTCLDSITGDGFLPLNETSLNFNRTEDGTIDSLELDRPRSVSLFGFGLNPNNEVLIKRNEEGKAVSLEIVRGNLGINNKISITYPDSNTIKIEQTKVGMIEDKMSINLTNDGRISSISSDPTFSLKQLGNAAKKGSKSLKGAKDAIMDIGVDAIKKGGTNDTLIVKYDESGNMIGTESYLGDSAWIYTDGASKIEYGDNGLPMSKYQTNDDFPWDSVSDMDIQYGRVGD